MKFCGYFVELIKFYARGWGYVFEISNYVRESFIFDGVVGGCRQRSVAI